MANIIGVRFKKPGKIYFFDPDGKKVERGQYVIVETAMGKEYGEVMIANRQLPEEKIVAPLKKIIRIATEKDRKQNEQNKKKYKKRDHYQILTLKGSCNDIEKKAKKLGNDKLVSMYTMALIKDNVSLDFLPNYVTLKNGEKIDKAEYIDMAIRGFVNLLVGFLVFSSSHLFPAYIYNCCSSLSFLPFCLRLYRFLISLLSFLYRYNYLLMLIFGNGHVSCTSFCFGVASMLWNS